MKLLSTLRLKQNVRPDDVEGLVVAETQAVWQRYVDGRIRELYGLPGGPGAVFILEYESLDAALQDLGDLPLVQAGYVDVDLVELRPFTSWQSLFKEEFTPMQVGRGHYMRDAVGEFVSGVAYCRDKPR